jgi:hypothetical protein
MGLLGDEAQAEAWFVTFGDSKIGAWFVLNVP